MAGRTNMRNAAPIGPKNSNSVVLGLRTAAALPPEERARAGDDFALAGARDGEGVRARDAFAGVEDLAGVLAGDGVRDADRPERPRVGVAADAAAEAAVRRGVAAGELAWARVVTILSEAAGIRASTIVGGGERQQHDLRPCQPRSPDPAFEDRDSQLVVNLRYGSNQAELIRGG